MGLPCCKKIIAKTKGDTSLYQATIEKLITQGMTDDLWDNYVGPMVAQILWKNPKIETFFGSSDSTDFRHVLDAAKQENISKIDFKDKKVLLPEKIQTQKSEDKTHNIANNRNRPGSGSG